MRDIREKYLQFLDNLKMRNIRVKRICMNSYTLNLLVDATFDRSTRVLQGGIMIYGVEVGVDNQLSDDGFRYE